MNELGFSFALSIERSRPFEFAAFENVTWVSILDQEWPSHII